MSLGISMYLWNHHQNYHQNLCHKHIHHLCKFSPAIFIYYYYCDKKTTYPLGKFLST